MKSSNSTWEIEHPCPQCGAPVTLEETDRLFLCGYCRNKLYLLPRGYFSYYLPSSPSYTEEILYVPYWRFKGLVFLCQDHDIISKVKDLTWLASSHRFLPWNLGFRPQTLKLRFLSGGMKGKFFRSEVPVETGLQFVGEEYLSQLSPSQQSQRQRSLRNQMNLNSA